VLVAPTLATVQFRHALLAETVATRLTPSDRRALHADLAAAWQDHGAVDARARAAAHGLLAVPHVDAVIAAAAALDAARDERRTDPSSALRLLADAIDVLEQYAPQELQLRAEALIELGDTRVAAVDWPSASDAFERAAALTARLDDAELHGRAEARAALHMTMFDDDPVRRGRLEAALDRLPDGDQPRRVELLGRLSVAELGRGDLWPQARRHADAAIAMARRLGDPELIATALVDRHLTTMDGADLEARAAAADELVELGERARRPDRVLVGQQWRYGAALSRGDLAGATAVLDDTEVLAALMPSPEWTYGVLLRRALIAAIEGDHATALALVEQSRPLGERVLWPDEALGLDVGARTLIQRITGIVDPALPALHDEFAAMSTIAR
jgi:hypothetical protein